MSIIVSENEVDLIRDLMKLISNLAKQSIEKNGNFKIGLSGGSLVKFLTTGLPTIQDTDLRKWLFFFCDERLVTVDDPESTFGTYKRELLGKIDIKIDQFVTIKQGVSAKDAALDYIEKLEKHFGKNAIPEFDLLLLGMGPDGHTCSLFPGHQLLNETTSWVCAITDSPKPPPERITLTFPVINNAKCCVFAISGASKADMVKQILVDKKDLPAGRVKPKGSLYWLLEKGAAKHIKI